MTVPLDMRNDIREMEAAGVSRSEIARKLRLSRNTVAKYADMEDMSPCRAPWSPKDNTRPLTHMPKLSTRCSHPTSGHRGSSAIPPRESTTGSSRNMVTGAPTPLSSATSGMAAGPHHGHRRRLPRARVGARRRTGRLRQLRGRHCRREDALKLLVLTLPHSNARYAVACRSQRSECMCAALSEIFGWIGRAPSVLVLDNATEAGRRVRGEVSESHCSRCSARTTGWQAATATLIRATRRVPWRTPWGSSGATSWCRCPAWAPSRN